MIRAACITSLILMSVSIVPSASAAELPSLPPLPAVTLPDGIADYLEGLDALEAGRYAAAAAHLGKAINADEDRADYWLARGVAHALDQKLESANRDLTRANRLSQADQHVRLWLATVIAMAGDFQKDATIFPPLTRDPYENAVRIMSRQYGQFTYRKSIGQVPADMVFPSEDAPAPKQEPQSGAKPESSALPKRNPALPSRNQPDQPRSREEERQRAETERDRLMRELLAAERAREQAQNQVGEDDPVKGFIQERRAANRSFPAIARQFSARMKSAEKSIGRLLLQRGIKRYGNQAWARAFEDLERARQSAPEDVYVLFHHAGCAMELGAPELAMETYTAALTSRPLLAEAYIGRALAAAKIGDVDLAREDLAFAAVRKLTLAAAYRDRVNAAVAAHAKAPSPERLAAAVTKLQQSAAAGATLDQLRAGADVIAAQANAGRRRATVAYQRGLRDRVVAVDANPASADAHTALGEYLYSESSNTFGEAVEPRARFKPYRPNGDAVRRRELAAAEAALDKALSLDPNHARAQAFKAACLMESYSAAAWARAEALLRKSLATKSDDSQVLGLFTVLMDKVATMKIAQASSLRTPDRWEDYYYIYTRYPSQAELREAAALERRAKAMWALGRKSLEAAAKANGKWGAYFKGVLARLDNDAGAARAAFEQAVKLDPQFIDAHRQLSWVYAQLGQVEESILTQTRAVNVNHTTAAPLLQLCWRHVSRAAMKGGRLALDRADAWDPTDPRIAAYRGMLALDKGNEADARAWFAAAAALDAAQAKLRGVHLAGGAGAPLSPEDAGFTLQLNLRMASMMSRAGRIEDALEGYRACIALEERVPLIEQFAPAASAMLPQPIDPGHVPPAPTVHVMSLFAHAGAGKSLAALGKEDQAMRQFEWVLAFESRKPPAADSGPLVWEPVTQARIGKARLHLKRGQVNEASNLIFEGVPRNLSPQTDAAYRKVWEELRAAKQKQIE